MTKRLCGAVLIVPALVAPAFAHTSERGQVMLLPTELYVAGGALVVAASVVLVALLPLFRRRAPQSAEIAMLQLTPLRGGIASLLGLAVTVLLVTAGFLGLPDPIANPLPGAVWTLWWTGLTILTIAFGNLWAAVNPWTGLHDMVRREAPPLRYPPALGHWPAVVMFLGFAWFELVYPTPFDPARLAAVVAAYVGLTFAGLFVFGRQWLEKAECFTVYFRMVSWLSPLQWRQHDGALWLRFQLPGAALGREGGGTKVSGAFILLALSTVSFDGFMRTFFWAGVIGFNPLEYPGRSALIVQNSIGVVVMFLCLAAGFGLAVALGRMLASGVNGVKGLVCSIVPIALAYHLAHYLPDFPIGLMQSLEALNDPFGTGLNLLGTGELHPPASILMDHDVAELVFRSQTAIIVVGHVVAVVAAHAMALEQTGSARDAIVGLLPLNAAMVGYTIFGLWLLSTPVVG